jgi:hypothetical protein
LPRLTKVKPAHPDVVVHASQHAPGSLTPDICFKLTPPRFRPGELVQVRGEGGGDGGEGGEGDGGEGPLPQHWR